VKYEKSIDILTQCIEKIIEEEKYCAADYEIIEKIPALNTDLLIAVIKDEMKEIIETNDNGTTYFQLIKNHFPDNLNDKIHEAINKLNSVNLEITQDALHVVLSLLYQKNFNETYSLHDMKKFRKIIEQHYNGADRNWKNNIFTVSTDKE
jgi:predicted house-cleaning noncanonical NTP pyrophosphatase (MazG superfamily)